MQDSTTSREGKVLVKLPRARKKERDTLCSVVHNIVSRDVISDTHTKARVSYVTQESGFPLQQALLQDPLHLRLLVPPAKRDDGPS